MKNKNFLRDYILSVAERHGWTHTYEKEHLLGFSNPKLQCHMDVYFTLRVITCMRHPKQGVTILERNKINISDLDWLFQNPRIHTNRGKLI